MDQTPPTPVHARHHAVQFYGDEVSLFTTVGSFISEGLVAGQPAIIIATEPHRVAIVEQLTARMIDVERALKAGELVLLDAQEALAEFMCGEWPDPVAFEERIGRRIGALLEQRPRSVVRAYGEMVDVLWKEGRSDAAIRLEILWNQLATQYGFALLCGYSMGNFYKQAEKFQEVLDQHTHASVDPDARVAVFDPKRTERSA